MKIAVFASHNGSNLQSIIDAIDNKTLNASISIVVSNNSNSGALERAKKHNIPGIHLSSHEYPDYDVLDELILETLIYYKTDLIFLAGYMKKIGPKVLSRFKGRIISRNEVPVLEHDTPEQLCERVMIQERKFIIDVLDKIQKKEIIL